MIDDDASPVVIYLVSSVFMLGYFSSSDIVFVKEKELTSCLYCDGWVVS